MKKDGLNGYIICSSDEKKTYFEANKDFLSMFECETIEEFMEYTQGDWLWPIYPEDVHAVKKSIQLKETPQMRGDDHIVYRIVSKKGKVRWIDHTDMHIFHDEYGEVDYYFLKDISECIGQVSAPHRLDGPINSYIRQSMNFSQVDGEVLTLLFMACRNILLLDGVFLMEINPYQKTMSVAYESCGAEAPPMKGLKIPITETEIARMKKQTERNAVYAYHIKHKGRPACVLAHGIIIDGAYEGCVGFVQYTEEEFDWTEEMRVALQKLARPMRQVVQVGRNTRFMTHIQEQHAVIDALGNEFSTIMCADFKTGNLVFTRLEGYLQNNYYSAGTNVTVSDFFGNHMEDDVHEEDRKKLKAYTDLATVEKLLRENGVIVERFRAKRDDGWHHFRLNLVPLEKNGEIYGAVYGYTQIDEEVRRDQEYERTLQQALLKAEEASEAKSRFLFNMSHDIRTPMNAVLGFAGLAEKNVDDREKVLDYLKKLEMSGEYLLDLINNVLDMAKIESGKMTIEEETVNLFDFADMILTMIAPEAAKKGICIKNEIDLVHTQVYCDVLKTRQAILNLLSNALKYSNAGGEVSFSMKECPSSREGYATYEFAVKDNGIGMSNEFLEHIFEMFQREKSTTLSGVQGTGLGLSIAHKIVEMMGGTIKVNSEQGVGTEMIVCCQLRIADEEKVTAEEENEEKGLVGKRVLLVEDNDLNREIVCELLKAEQMEVEEAVDGSEGVEMLLSKGSGYYDLVLMDIQMPIMNGYVATQMIRAFEDTTLANIPILAMTANAFEEDRKKAFEVGMNEHVAKPVNVADLFSKIQKFL